MRSMVDKMPSGAAPRTAQSTQVRLVSRLRNIRIDILANRPARMQGGFPYAKKPPANYTDLVIQVVEVLRYRMLPVAEIFEALEQERVRAKSTTELSADSSL
jgi:hypothetical protein